MWSKLNGLARRLANLPLIDKIVPRSMRGKLRPYLEAKSMRRLPDRLYMERTILPALGSLKPARVLFVGVERYTTHYSKWFPHSEYWTIDIRPEVAPMGAKGKHIVGDVVEVDKHFMPGYFDLVFLNGVLGWGVDSVDDQNAALEAIRTIMRPDAALLLGWNDNRVKEPLDLAAIKSGFKHGLGDALPARQSFPDCTHVYDFFQARPKTEG